MAKFTFLEVHKMRKPVSKIEYDNMEVYPVQGLRIMVLDAREVIKKVFQWLKLEIL